MANGYSSAGFILLTHFIGLCKVTDLFLCYANFIDGLRSEAINLNI